VPLKPARPGAFPGGSPGGMPTALYLSSAGCRAVNSQMRGAEQSTQPPFAAPDQLAADGCDLPPCRGGSRARPRPQAAKPAPAGCPSSLEAAIIAPRPIAPAISPRDASAVHLERLLRRHLEELRFTFGDEPLDDLQGFLICEDGNRALIAAADLGPDARSFLYLHCLGHLALGHVDGTRLSVTYEFRDRWRLPPAEQAREAAADAWAHQLLAYALAPQHGPAPGPRAIRHQLGALRLPPGYLRACLQRLRAALTADPAPAPRREQVAQ